MIERTVEFVDKSLAAKEVLVLLHKLVNESEPERVGDIVGVRVGTLVGVRVGTLVGALVGVLVGDLVVAGEGVPGEGVTGEGVTGEGVTGFVGEGV